MNRQCEPGATRANRRRGQPTTFIVALVACIGVAASALASPDGKPPSRPFSDSDLRGRWVFSGLLKFGAPIPFPATYVDGAPPQATIAPGELVGVWSSILGLMTFDGRGKVTAMEDVIKVGEVIPQSPFPLPNLPPLPEVGTGEYSVADNGVVTIELSGRDPNRPVGTVDFEVDYHCVLVRKPRAMQCVFARFTTFVVDSNGFESPITGVLGFQPQR